MEGRPYLLPMRCGNDKEGVSYHYRLVLVLMSVKMRIVEEELNNHLNKKYNLYKHVFVERHIICNFMDLNIISHLSNLRPILLPSTWYVESR